jgi:hypothetical protein
MSTIKLIGVWALVIFGVLLLSFGLEYFNLVSYRFFGVRYEDNKRNIYENSQSYVEGKKGQLNKSLLEFKTAGDEVSRKGIKNMIAHEFSEFNEDDTKYNLTSEQKDFLKDMKYQVEIDTFKYPHPDRK